jgi:hypothetical protein
VNTITTWQRQAWYINLQMDPLYNPQRTYRIQTGREMSIEPYPNWQFVFVDNPDRKSGCGSVPTRTRTRSDGPELLLTPSTPTTLSLCTIRLLPSNHSSWSDIPSESYPMMLHTTNRTSFLTTTPPHPASQHLRPLPYHNKLYRHQLAAASASCNVSAFP